MDPYLPGGKVVMNLTLQALRNRFVIKHINKYNRVVGSLLVPFM